METNVEGLIILIDWQDRYASNERTYKIYFEEIDDLKVIINNMKKHTRQATKDATGIISIFVSLHMGFGKQPVHWRRYNLDLFSMTSERIELQSDILNREKIAKEHETIFLMVNDAFVDINHTIKTMQKERAVTE